MLESRLAEALRLYREAPRLVVVSGRGEAEVMAAWLAEQGVAAEHIVVEPFATSTNENLERARALLPDAPLLTAITSTFHVARTRVWAWHLGIPVRMVAAPTPKASRKRNYARELVALPHSAARVAWRRFVRRALGR